MKLHRVRYGAMCCLTVGGALVTPLCVSAQTTVASAAHANGATTSKADQLLSRAITVRLESSTLKQALAAVADQANVRIAYRLEALAAAEHAVSLRVVNKPLGAVLDELLLGTALRVTVTGDDVLALEPRVIIADGTIVGTVRSAKTKAPVAGATILIGDATKGVVTDESGAFKLPLAAGDQQITVRAVGYTRQARTVRIQEGQTLAVEFLLEPSTSVLSEVVVTGTVVATERKAIPTPITVIRAEDIEKRGITRIEQLLRGEVPGVVALERGTQLYDGMDNNKGGPQLAAMATSSIYSRGSSTLDGSPNPLKTYVDGVEVLNSAYLGTIDPKSIERIEIITGPQAATIYGSGAMGGVMQIFTKKGNGQSTPDLTLTMKVGQLQNSYTDGITPAQDYTFNVIGGSGPAFSYAGSASYQYMGQWQPKLFARTYGFSGGVTHTRGPVVISGTYAMTEGRNGTAVGGNSMQYKTMVESGEAPQEWTPAAFYNDSRIATSSSTTASLNADYRPWSAWQHHLTLGKSQMDFKSLPQAPRNFRPDDTLFTFASATGQRTTVNYNMTILPPRNHVLSSTLTMGIAGSNANQIQSSGCAPKKGSSSLMDCGADSDWNAYVNSGLTGMRISNPINEKSWGGFSSLQVGVFDRMYLTFGLRGEQNPAYGREHRIDWTPTNGVTYTIEAGDLTLKLLGSYGRATRPPAYGYRDAVLAICGECEPSEYVSQFESLNLRPEKSSGPQGGFELYYGNIGSLTLNRYTQTVTDLIMSVKVDSVFINYPAYSYSYYQGQYQYQNVASVRQFGWEGTGSINLGPLAVRGTYSWSDSRVRSVGATAASWERALLGQTFQGLPSHLGNISVNYAHGGTSVTLTSNYVGSSQQSTYSTVMYYGFQYLRHSMYSSRLLPINSNYSAPGYVKSDLAISHRFTPWASFTMNMMNLGNSFAADYGSISPSLGRQTYMGVSLKWPTR